MTIYLDDVLSAVDAHTARFIYRNCLRGDLLKNRTVVLVSHNVNLVIQSARFVIQLDNGRIQKSGSKEDFISELKEVDVNAKFDDDGEPESITLDATAQSGLPEKVRLVYEEEKREIGRVGSHHYLFLLRAAGGLPYWIIFALIYGGAQLFSFLEALWLKYWTGDTQSSNLNHYLSGYAIIVTSGIMVGGLRWVWLYGVRFGRRRVGFCDRAAPLIHDMMLRRLVHSPLSMFTSWPIGRLLNRFSEDINRVDGFISDDFGRSVTAGRSH
jgi:ABC-type multidrug transport system fused ATPase/permease subunit